MRSDFSVYGLQQKCKRLVRTLAWNVAACLLLTASVVYGDSLRCGTKLIVPGDLTLQVREKCGDPISEELIGYTLRAARHRNDATEREYKIEQWVYGPEQGYYHVLTFEGGRLRDIEDVRQ